MQSSNIVDFNHHQAEGDANLLICQTVVDLATQCTTILIGDDTDLLVLLCFHPNSFNLYLRSEAKRPLHWTSFPDSGTNRKLRIWNILAPESTRPRNMPLLSFYIHNITGCGTTSRLLGVGKGATQKKLRIYCNFKKQAKVIYGEVTKNEIISAGEEVLTCLYGANLREDGCTLLQAILRKSSSKDFLCEDT